jgi:hypothetical protein
MLGLPLLIVCWFDCCWFDAWFDCWFGLLLAYLIALFMGWIEDSLDDSLMKLEEPQLLLFCLVVGSLILLTSDREHKVKSISKSRSYF